jgi:hypothetical protein
LFCKPFSEKIRLDEKYVRVLGESLNLSQGLLRETADANELLESRAIVGKSPDGIVESIHLQDRETSADGIKVKSGECNRFIGTQETSKMGPLLIGELGEHSKKPVGFTSCTLTLDPLARFKVDLKDHLDPSCSRRISVGVSGASDRIFMNSTSQICLAPVWRT